MLDNIVGAMHQPQFMQSQDKSLDNGTKLLQYMCHLMHKLGLISFKLCPSPLYNDNQVTIAWIKAKLVTSKKMLPLNIPELAILGAQDVNEVDMKCAPGSKKLTDLFTKEHKHDKHYEELRDLVVPLLWPAKRREDV